MTKEEMKQTISTLLSDRAYLLQSIALMRDSQVEAMRIAESDEGDYATPDHILETDIAYLNHLLDRFHYDLVSQ